ncbi:baseplate J/gp47 family protein [Spirillospora sp. NPDC029432]|uniref:baseplate J/gp47 family protein n=1 Tax=Spirillospora sp. NPDC029432 TaxID=3154599 RepID=UPI003451F3CB
MAFGVTPDGFALKRINEILAGSCERARAVFGPEVDLSNTSPLGMLLEVVAAEDAELWKELERTYYSMFVSSATGDALDLLGDDAGLGRRTGPRSGDVEFTLEGGAPGRVYALPEGVLVTLPNADRVFRTLVPAVLTAEAPVRTVSVVETAPGGGPVNAGTLDRLHPDDAARHLAGWAPAALAVTNPLPFEGTSADESDDSYRGRLLALPRTVWTVETVRQAALGTEGVLDVRLSDPVGGVDVTQSVFGLFTFDQRAFIGERRIGEPYFADLAVAHDPAHHWEGTGDGTAPGLRDRVRRAVDRVRPIGVHVNIVEADHIDVGVRARVLVAEGADGAAAAAAIRARLADDIGRLRLGSDVLYSKVMGAIAAQEGVVDVRDLRLRRCPAAFGRVGFGTVPYQAAPVEAPLGENLVMGPTEIPMFRPGGDLAEIEVATR